MRINELNTQLKGLCQNANELLDTTGMSSYGIIENVEFDRSNFDETLFYDEFYSIMKKLDNICFTVKYLNTKVYGEYTIYKNSAGRYECSEYTYTSGSTIEFLYYDKFDAKYKWVISQVEHNGIDYYIVDYRNLPLEGLRVRVRKEMV